MREWGESTREFPRAMVGLSGLSLTGEARPGHLLRASSLRDSCSTPVVKLFYVQLPVNLTHLNRVNLKYRRARSPEVPLTPAGAYPETNLASMIISFSSPPTLSSVSRFAEDVSEGEDFYMNDGEDFEAERATITSPGESITSARAFMRWGCLVVPFHFSSHNNFQGTWHLRG